MLETITELFPSYNAKGMISFSSLFVEKLPSHRDYQQCAVPEKQDIMKVLWGQCSPVGLNAYKQPLLIHPPLSFLLFLIPLRVLSTKNSFH